MSEEEGNCSFVNQSGDFSQKLTPEERLFIAIIQRAVLDANLPSYEEFRLSAKRWLFSEKKDEWTFVWLSEQLGLSSNCIKLIRKRAKMEGKLVLAHPRIRD